MGVHQTAGGSLKDSELSAEIERSEAKHQLAPAAAAAELMRIFRNHVVHGREVLPAYNLEPCWRFYAATRVLLLLTQHFVLRRAIDPDKLVPLSVNIEELGEEPAGCYLQNLHYEDRIWRTSSPPPVKYGRTVQARWFGG